MNTSQLKLVSAVAVLLGSIAAPVANANLMNDAITARDGTDIFRLKCESGAVGARAVIQDATQSPDGVELSVHIVSRASKRLWATTTTAPDIAFSMANLAKGGRVYHFVVTKNKGEDVEPYQIDPYCYNSAGARIGPDAKKIQDDQDDT